MDKNFFSLKKLLVSYMFGVSPICILMGILSLIGTVPVYFNEKPYDGVTGLIISFLLIPFIGVVLGFANWLFLNLGIFIYRSVFRNKQG